MSPSGLVFQSNGSLATELSRSNAGKRYVRPWPFNSQLSLSLSPVTPQEAHSEAKSPERSNAKIAIFDRRPLRTLTSSLCLRAKSALLKTLTSPERYLRYPYSAIRSPQRSPPFPFSPRPVTPNVRFTCYLTSEFVADHWPRVIPSVDPADPVDLRSIGAQFRPNTYVAVQAAFTEKPTHL